MICVGCGVEIYGKADKKYCSDTCRKAVRYVSPRPKRAPKCPVCQIDMRKKADMCGFCRVETAEGWEQALREEAA